MKTRVEAERFFVFKLSNKICVELKSHQVIPYISVLILLWKRTLRPARGKHLRRCTAAIIFYPLMILLHSIEGVFTTVPAKYVRIKAIQYGKLPAWYEGAGGDTHIFVDEINVQ